MEGGTFLDDRIQDQFARFVEIRVHQDHPEKRNENKLLQRELFGNLALPFYALTDPTGKKVYWTGAGAMSVDKFLEGLKKVP